MKNTQPAKPTAGLLITTFLICALLALPALAQTPADTAARIIRTVRIEGADLVPQAEILSNIRSRSGAALDIQLVEKDARRIIALPQIADVKWSVQPHADQVDLVFTITESERVVSIEILGNKSVPTEDLLNEIGLAENDFLDLYAINSGTRALEDYYHRKGYYFATAQLNKSLLKKERKIIYLIVEGPKLRVKKVRFEGNQSIKAGKLKSKISTKAHFPLLSKGRLDDEMLDLDILALSQYYQSKGFLDARVFARKDFNEKRTKVTVTFVIEEGLSYQIVGIRFTGNHRFSDQQLNAELTEFNIGDTFTEERIVKARRALRHAYGRYGYIETRIQIGREFTEQPGEVIPHIAFAEGDPFNLGQVIIRGNEKTKDKVVRRSFDRHGFLPGGLYDTEAMGKGRNRLMGSRLFTNVDVNPIGDQPDQRDALVEVVEDRTGNMIFAIAADDTGDIRGEIGIEQYNFDIADYPKSLKDLFAGTAFVGAGQTAKISFSPGTKRSSGRFSFHDPYIFDQPYFLNLDLFTWRYERDSYDERRAGSRIKLGRRFDNDWSIDVSLRGETIRISDLDDAYLIPGDPTSLIITAPIDVQEVEGNNTLTSVGAGIGRDTTDRIFRPSEGYRFRVGYEQVGALGGDFTYAAFTSNLSAYRTLHTDIAERKTILAGRVVANTIVNSAPVFERYYVGGTKLRGFDYIGPRGGADEDPIGSEWMFLAKSEISRPIIEKMITGKVFCDTGIVETGPYRVTFGFGFDLFEQQVPMTLDFGFPVYFDEEDKRDVFLFSLGYFW